MTDTPIVQTIDNHTYYRASSLGYCPNAFIFARQNHSPSIPPNIQAAFDYGISNEKRVIELLLQKGYDVYGQQIEVTLPVSPDISIIGHIDGLVNAHYLTPIPEMLVEIKCLNQDNTDKFLADPAKHFLGYLLQTSAYTAAIGISNILFAILNKDTDEIHEVQTHPFFDKKQVISRVLTLEQYWLHYQRTDELKPCPDKRFCPFYYLHDQLPGNEIEEIDDPVLGRLLTTHQSLAKEMDRIKQRKDALDAQLKHYLSRRDTYKGRVGELSFTLSDVETTRLDTKKVTAYLKAEGKLPEYSKSYKSQRLTVKEEDAPN